MLFTLLVYITLAAQSYASELASSLAARLDRRSEGTLLLSGSCRYISGPSGAGCVAST